MNRTIKYLRRPDVRIQPARLLVRRVRYEVERRALKASLEVDRLVHLEGDIAMLVRVTDMIERSIYLYGCHEYASVKVFNSLLGRRMTVVDAGAHVGQFSLLAARGVGPRGRVLAFEPEPRVRARLERNISLNGLCNVTILPAALSDADGWAPLRTPPESGRNSGLASLRRQDALTTEEVVPCARLDTVLSRLGVERVDLMKVDVEGLEAEVFDGAASTLAAWRPHILFEAWTIDADHGRGPYPAIERLRSFGYEVYGIVMDGRGGCSLEKVRPGDEPQRYREPWQALNLVALHEEAVTSGEPTVCGGMTGARHSGLRQGSGNGSMQAGIPRDRPGVLVLGAERFSDKPGGLNRYVADQLAALERAGRRPGAVAVGRLPEVGSHGGAAGRRHARLPARLRAYARAAARAAGDAEVVDAHFALYAFLPVVLGALRRKPLVVHFQGPWAEEGRMQGDGRWQACSKRWVERAVYRRARELVVLSGAFKRILVERYGISPWRVHVVAPGVDLERFCPGPRAEARSRLGVPEGAWVAFTARRLVPRMGLDVLLEAWAGLVGRAGREDLLLCVAGDGPLRPDLETRAAELGVAGSVRFLGRVSDEELADCYRAADVCVVPSVALEGYGLVVLEALACGTPVVGTDAGGLAEAVGGLHPGLVVPAGEATAMRDRLLGAVDGSAPLPGAGACRRHAEGFSWERVVERHLDIYGQAAEPAGPKALRVVYLDHTARLSGGELALLRLLPAMQGVEAHVVLAEEGPLVPRLLRRGISVEVLPMAEAARGLSRDRVRPGALPAASVLRSAAYVVRLARRLRRLRPDLVHANSLKSALYGGLAGRIAGVPVVWHVRDRIAGDYLPPAAVRLVRAAARWLPAGAVANSATTLATLGNVRRSVVVPSPVAGGAPATAANGGPLRVGVLGRLAPWKGQHVFLQAFAHAFPHGDEQAVLVGAALFGEEAYARELRDLAGRVGLDGRVEFRGFREDVAAELARLDVLVHCSVVPEPFGQVVLEGMAAGIPVVAAAAGGPAEVVDDGVNGLLYPPGDAAALAALLRRLAADPGLRRRLGAAGPQAAEAFSPEAVAARMGAFYTELTGNRSE